MSKIETLADVPNVAPLNGNNDKIEAAFQNTLSRDGSTPNQMEANLDMNNNRILNLPDAVHNQEPITLAQAANIASVSVVFSRENVGAVFYPRTDAEIAAGVTPTVYYYPAGDPRRYGAVGDGLTNDYTAVQAAFSVGGDIYLAPELTFLVNTALTGVSNTRVWGGGTLLGGHAGTMLTFTSKSNVKIHGINFDGNNTSDTLALFDTCTDVEVDNCNGFDTLYDGAETYAGGFLFSACTRPRLTNTRLYNISVTEGQTRAMAFTSCTEAVAANLHIDGCGKALSLANTTDFSISNVVMEDVGDNGMYINGTIARGSISNFVMNGVQEGIVLNSSEAEAGIVISNGFIKTASTRGITLRTGGGYHLSNIVVDGAPNLIAQSSSYAGVTDSEFHGLVGRNITSYGVFISQACNGLHFYDLRLYEVGNATAVVVGNGTNNIYFYNPWIYDSTATMTKAIDYASNGSTDYVGGVFNLSTDAATPIELEVDGTHDDIRVYPPIGQVSVASATDVAYRPQATTWRVTGTTTINTIAAPPQGGVELTLIFTAACAVNDNGVSSGNIKLASAFTSSADDVLKIVWNSVDSMWHEVSRSVN